MPWFGSTKKTTPKPEVKNFSDCFEDDKLDSFKTLVCEFKRLFKEIFTEGAFVKREGEGKEIVELGSYFNLEEKLKLKNKDGSYNITTEHYKFFNEIRKKKLKIIEIILAFLGKEPFMEEFIDLQSTIDKGQEGFQKEQYEIYKDFHGIIHPVWEQKKDDINDYQNLTEIKILKATDKSRNECLCEDKFKNDSSEYFNEYNSLIKFFKCIEDVVEKLNFDDMTEYIYLVGNKYFQNRILDAIKNLEKSTNEIYTKLDLNEATCKTLNPQDKQSAGYYAQSKKKNISNKDMKGGQSSGDITQCLSQAKLEKIKDMVSELKRFFDEVIGKGYFYDNNTEKLGEWFTDRSIENFAQVFQRKQTCRAIILYLSNTSYEDANLFKKFLEDEGRKNFVFDYDTLKKHDLISGCESEKDNFSKEGTDSYSFFYNLTKFEDNIPKTFNLYENMDTDELLESLKNLKNSTNALHQKLGLGSSGGGKSSSKRYTKLSKKRLRSLKKKRTRNSRKK